MQQRHSLASRPYRPRGGYIAIAGCSHKIGGLADVSTIKNPFLALFHPPFAHSGLFFEIVRSYSKWKQPSCRRTSGSRALSSLASGVKDGRNGKELDQLALNDVHCRFQAIVGPQLLVDVVKVIAQGLQADL